MTRFDTGTYMSTNYAWKQSPSLFVWYHVGCSFDPSTKVLSLYVNGTKVSQSTFSGSMSGFQHSSFVPIGLGNRPFSNPNQGFIGTVDEFAMWER